MRLHFHEVTILAVIVSTRAAYAQPAVGLSPPQVDETLVAQGEIDNGARLGGIVTASILGFGAGQAAEGRWHDTGWIFTVGESASAGVVLGGFAGTVSQCPLYFRTQETAGCKVADGVVVGGLIAWGVFRLAGVFDAALGPSVHNRHVREARQRLGRSGRSLNVMPYVAPASHGEVAGVALTF